MLCPVCPRTDLPAATLECPNCGVDLRPLVRLRELPRYRYNQALRQLSAGRPADAARALHAALAEGADPTATEPLLDEATALLAPVVGSAPPQPERRAAFVGLVGAGLAGLLFGLLVSLFHGGSAASERSASPGAATPPPGARPAATAEAVLVPPSAAAPESTSSLTTRPAAELAGLEAYLAKLPGVRVSLARDRLRLRFLEGLFDGDSSTLERSSRERLAQVRSTLAAWGKPLQVTVQGFTAPSATDRGDTRTDWGLSFRRASAAVLELHAAGSPKLGFIAVGSERSEQPPFAADSERGKNRTVVLDIAIPAGGG